MIASRLGAEYGWNHIDWLIFAEGEEDMEALREGLSVSAKVYDDKEHNSWASAEVGLEDITQPRVQIGHLGYEFNLPEAMNSIGQGELSCMRASSKSDVPAVHKVFYIKAGDYETPEIDSKQDYLDFNDMVYKQTEIPYGLPRRENYIEAVRNRAMTDRFIEEFGENLSQ